MLYETFYVIFIRNLLVFFFLRSKIFFFFRGYNDLADRKQCREGTWHNPGWNDVVSNTVPLIRSMSTRILEPLPFSPTQ